MGERFLVMPAEEEVGRVRLGGLETFGLGGGSSDAATTLLALLPRGTRVKSNVSVPLKQVLLGPSRVTDGTQNLVGALRRAAPGGWRA